MDFPKVMANLSNPGGMIDQSLEYIAPFYDVLKVCAVHGTVGMNVNIAMPLPGFERWQCIEPMINASNVVIVDSLLDDCVSSKVEQVFFQVMIWSCRTHLADISHLTFARLCRRAFK